MLRLEYISVDGERADGARNREREKRREWTSERIYLSICILVSMSQQPAWFWVYKPIRTMCGYSKSKSKWYEYAANSTSTSIVYVSIKIEMRRKKTHRIKRMLLRVDTGSLNRFSRYMLRFFLFIFGFVFGFFSSQFFFLIFLCVLMYGASELAKQNKCVCIERL